MKNDKELQDEEEFRRKRVMQGDREDLNDEVLERILDNDPSLARLLGGGKNVKSQNVTEVAKTVADGGDYDPPYYPDRLKIIKECHHDGTVSTWNPVEGTFRKEQPVNRKSTVQFDLNAPNDYFERSSQPGVLMVDGVGKEGWSFYNGVLSLNFSIPEEAEAGDVSQVVVTVNRAKSAPLQRVFEIEYTDPVARNTGGGEKNPPSTEANLLGSLRPQPVYKPTGENSDETTWDEIPEEWDEKDVVLVNEHGDGLDVYINMDSTAFHRYIQDHNFTDSGKEYVKDVWISGVTLYSVSQWLQMEDMDDVDRDEIVPLSMQGVAQSMLPQHITGNDLEQIEV